MERSAASDPPVIWDAHVHVGRFRDFYFDPVQVALDLIRIGIQRWVVSSTTLCEGVGSFEESLRELEAMETVAHGRVIPFLWVVPEMLDNIDRYLDPRFQGLKVHAHAQRWSPNGAAIQSVARIAAQKKIPLKLHTGGQVRCDAGVYRKLCRNNPDTQFILAHGRPADQALEVLKECPNAVADTAFMPIADVAMLVRCGMSKQILFGSDYPLDQVYSPDDSSETRYRTSLKAIRKVAPDAVFYSNISNTLTHKKREKKD